MSLHILHSTSSYLYSIVTCLTEQDLHVHILYNIWMCQATALPIQYLNMQFCTTACTHWNANECSSKGHTKWQMHLLLATTYLTQGRGFYIPGICVHQCNFYFISLNFDKRDIIWAVPVCVHLKSGHLTNTCTCTHSFVPKVSRFERFKCIQHALCSNGGGVISVGCAYM